MDACEGRQTFTRKAGDFPAFFVDICIVVRYSKYANNIALRYIALKYELK